MGTVAAADSPHSLFVGANGALLVCGFEDKPGTLGLPRDQGDNEGEEAQVRTLLVPTPIPSMPGVPFRHVVAGYYGSLAVSEAGQVYMWGCSYYGALRRMNRTGLCRL
jgi:alpha-tubulin suppressor-like RCC1 family protein